MNAPTPAASMQATTSRMYASGFEGIRDSRRRVAQQLPCPLTGSDSPRVSGRPEQRAGFSGVSSVHASGQAPSPRGQATRRAGLSVRWAAIREIIVRREAPRPNPAVRRLALPVAGSTPAADDAPVPAGRAGRQTPGPAPAGSSRVQMKSMFATVFPASTRTSVYWSGSSGGLLAASSSPL